MLPAKMFRQTNNTAVVGRFLSRNIQLDIGNQKRTRRIVHFRMFVLSHRRFKQTRPLESNVFGRRGNAIDPILFLR